MGEKFRLVVTSLFVTFAMVLPACSANGDKAHHTHTYSEEWSSDETYHWHAATCEHTDKVKDKAEHTFTTQVVEPSFESGGYTIYTCSVCGYSYTGNETAQLQHHYSEEWSHDDNNHYHLCTDTGYETLKDGVAPHTFVDVVTYPTFETEGFTTHTCSVCGYYYIDTPTSQLPHNFEAGWQDDENNHWHACIDAGYETLKDGVAPHSYGEIITDTPATELAEGVGHKVCEVCGHTVSVSIDKLDHDWGEPTYVWSNDHSSCTAKIVCKNDTELTHVITETVDSTYSIITKAGCETNGAGRYSAHFVNEHFTDQVFDIVLEAIGHEFGEPSYEWASDYSTCTATRVCAHDETHVETETVAVTTDVITPVTMYDDGEVQYIAEFTNPAFARQVKNVILDATGTAEKLKFTIDPYDGHCSVSAKSTSIRGEVVIPSKYNGVPVSEIDDYGFKNCGHIISIVVPDTVNEIGYEAFLNCYRLTVVINKSSIIMSVGSHENGYIASYARQVISDPAYSRLSVDEAGNVTYNDGSDIWGIGYVGEDTDVVIPSTITKLSKYAFVQDEYVTSIVVPDSINEIAQGTFAGCSSLESITLPFVGGDRTNYRFLGYIFGSPTTMWYVSDYVPESLKTVILSEACTAIEYRAFVDCKYLETVVMSDSVTSIGDWAFDGCISLKSVNIPNSVTTIGDSAFMGCSSLEHLSIPFVGKSATASENSRETVFGFIFGYNSYEGGVETKQFYNQLNYQMYYIPETLKHVTVTGDRTLFYGSFNNCNNLESITLAGNITEIKMWSFGNCSGLKSLVIPNSVTTIGNNILGGCTSLESLTVPSLTSKNALKYYFGSDSSATVPTSLKNVTIAGSITTIASSAFANCSSIESVVLPDTITTIDYRGFDGCSSLKSIFIPKSVTKIADYAFSECLKLESVTFEEGSNLKSIGTSAFYKCKKLTSIVIPEGVETIGSSLFNYCEKIESITLPSTITNVKGTYSMFCCCYKLQSIDLPDCVTSIGEQAFRECRSLTSIDIPSGVTSIGKEAFYGCTGVKEFSIPSAVISIAKYAFYCCTSLESINIPRAVTTINEYTFAGCSALKTIAFDEDSQLTSIGERVFYACKGLESITLPNSVTSIGASSFMECSSLVSINLGTGLQTISTYAFYLCSALPSIHIPNSVTSIGSSSFSGCSLLTNIYYDGTADQWNAYGSASSFLPRGVVITIHCSDDDLVIDRT